MAFSTPDQPYFLMPVVVELQGGQGTPAPPLRPSQAVKATWLFPAGARWRRHRNETSSAQNDSQRGSRQSPALVGSTKTSRRLGRGVCLLWRRAHAPGTPSTLAPGVTATVTRVAVTIGVTDGALALTRATRRLICSYWLCDNAPEEGPTPNRTDSQKKP